MNTILRTQYARAAVIGELYFLLLLFIYTFAQPVFPEQIEFNILMLAFGVILFPFGTLLALYIAMFGTRYMTSLLQVVKFLLVGGLNTLVDLSIYVLLSVLFGGAGVILLTVFKGISFTVAVMNSFAWNKLWVFAEHGNRPLLREALSFLSVSVASLVVNIIVFGVTYSLLQMFSGFDGTILGIMSAFIAAASSFVWNFLGYKLFVFKRTA